MHHQGLLTPTCSTNASWAKPSLRNSTMRVRLMSRLRGTESAQDVLQLFALLDGNNQRSDWADHPAAYHSFLVLYGYMPISTLAGYNTLPLWQEQG